jgi:uncharacterized protein YjbI with pentapeptide repeats
MIQITLDPFIMRSTEKAALNQLLSAGNSFDNIIELLFNGVTDSPTLHTQKALKVIPPHRRDALLLVLRWMTPIGLACLSELTNFIKSNEVVDFQSFHFNYNGQSCDLNSLAAACRQKSHVGGYADVRGCNFSGLKLDGKILKNACFNYCDFSYVNWQQVSFINCNFVSTSFFGARLILIRLQGSVIWGECDFRNAFLNAIDFSGNENRISTSWLYNPLRYFTMLRYLCLAWGGNFSMASNTNHTVFWMITLPSENLFDHAHNYIKWYEGIHLDLQKLFDQKPFTKLGKSINMLLTKNWSSALIFTCWAFIFIMMYAALYHSLGVIARNDNQSTSIFDSMYFSVVTFTTLGYGDILPSKVLGKTIAMTEVLVGYIYLGLLVSLLGIKAGSR